MPCVLSPRNVTGWGTCWGLEPRGTRDGEKDREHEGLSGIPGEDAHAWLSRAAPWFPQHHTPLQNAGILGTFLTAC